MKDININRKDLYKFNTNDKSTKELNNLTKERLQQLIDLGVKEIGLAHFGIKGVISGIYIENVWNYSDKTWNEYVEWMKKVIKKHDKDS